MIQCNHYQVISTPTQLFQENNFLRKNPMSRDKHFPGYGSGSVVRNMMFLQYLYSGSSILQIHLRNCETTIWISYPCHILIGHLFQQSYDDALFSS